MSENQKPQSFPAVLEGTVFRPKAGTGKEGKPYIAFALAVYAGKDREGNYRKGPFVDVTVVGEAVAFGTPAEKDRVRVAGYLEERSFTRGDGTKGTGLSLVAFGIKKAEIATARQAPANGTPAAAAAPAPAPSAAETPPVGVDSYYDDGPIY